jgi:hypothetical protein
MAKQNNQHSNDNHQKNETEYAIFCDALEKEYKQAKEQGLFEVLKVLELDKEHSDSKLVQAIDYFNKKDGVIEKDAPIDFLSERNKKMVTRNGKFRADLYCMFLSTKFADAIEEKSAFIKDSYSYSFDSQ